MKKLKLNISQQEEQKKYNMQNHRVYLAKSDLARGLDFEYVKSNLLRIPGIEIMEFGGGVEPYECACTVYVHDDCNQALHEHELAINKNVYNDLGNSSDVFVYSGKMNHNHYDDVELDTPLFINTGGVWIHDEESWDNYGTLEISNEHHNLVLLMNVSMSMGLKDITSFTKNSRHYKPESKYAMPPIPNMDKRRSKGTTRLDNNQESIKEDRMYSPPEYLTQNTESTSVRLKKKRRI